jgi:hypothetical protein
MEPADPKPPGLTPAAEIATLGDLGGIVERAFQITINLKFKPINFFLSIFIIFFPFTQSSVKKTRRQEENGLLI